MTTANRIANVATYAIVTMIDDGAGVQTAQTEERAGTERLADVYMQYGVASVPLGGAQAIQINLAGSPDNAALVCVDDLRHRPHGQPAGSVSLYTHADEAAAVGEDATHRIQMLPEGRTIIVRGDVIVIEADSKITLRAPLIETVT